MELGLRYPPTFTQVSTTEEAAQVLRSTVIMLNEVARQVRFERSKYTTKSRRYTEEQLWDKIVAFIKEHDYICRRDASLRSFVKVSMMANVVSVAIGDFRIVASIYNPCSVNAFGKVLE